MLIQFGVSNYRSIDEEVVLSMVGSNLVSQDKQIDENNVFKAEGNLRLLKSVIVYGANASGKSNILRAISFMRKMVLNSSRESQADDQIKVEPFVFRRASEESPSSFECVFLLDGVEYRYGFEASKNTIVGEWLFRRPGTKEGRLFLREHQSIKISRDFKEGKGLEDKTRKNALFLSVVAQFNGQISSKILSWFSRIGVISGLNDMGYRNYTTGSITSGRYRDQISNLVNALDIGIDGFEVEEDTVVDPEHLADIPADLRDVLIRYSAKKSTVRTIHRYFDAEQGQEVAHNFDLDEHESEGTKKIFALAGPLVDTLTNGKVMIVDEFDARMHPLICRAVIGLFNSAAHNPRGAQLVVCTHDTNLLSNKLLRRDQIWFTEKDEHRATKLFSLAEFKVRNDASYESDYIRGKYGAIPFLGDFRPLIDDAHADA
jgi:hypothetical protein